jgi:phosphoenolpyruvate synthase/pyruvate phosphate dikinase
MFTLDTETGFPQAVLVSAAWGLGETVVSGQVDPDEYVVFKPALADPALTPVLRTSVGAKRRKAVYSPTGLTEIVATTPEERSARVLTDGEACALARWAVIVEQHYGCPMDLEWAKDGRTGELYVVQARPETVQSRRRTALLRSYRLTGEGERVLAEMAANGLSRGGNGLRVYVMAEIPANIVLAEQFAERFDGFSIGSNDLTQLTLGVDRDSALLTHLFDESNHAVTRSVEHLITTAHSAGRPVGLCGQRPSNDPAFTRFLVHAGIDSVSVTPDSFATVKQHVAAAEAGL